MCGIFGLIAKKNTFNENELINKVKTMKNALSHRGPDSFGFWTNIESNIVLGHTRLAILDKSSAGSQPMISKSNRYVISFNGEIYNHKNLRRKLSSDFNENNFWQGDSDTETLIECIDKWGLEMTLDNSYGMFAFALLDKIKNKFYLVRDRFGEKPLYWGFDNLNSFIFASEISAFKNLDNFSCHIDEKAVGLFFKYGYVPYPKCIYKNIKQLDPGKFLEINLNENKYSSKKFPKEKTWWDLNKKFFNNPKVKKSDAFHINHLEKSLKSVINEFSLADVPLGTFLSGGIDSSLITSILQSTSKSRIKTFTISFPEENSEINTFDESIHATCVANFLGTDHQNIPLTENNITEIIPKMAQVYSEPFSDASQIPTTLLCESVRNQNIIVALSGDGGDELFGGYNRHKIAPIIFKYGKYLRPEFRKFLGLSIENLPIPEFGLNKDKLQKIANAIYSSDDLKNVYENIISLWNFPNKVLFNKNQVSFNELNANSHSYKEYLPNELIMLEDIQNYLVNDILCKIDRASMHFGLETRAPFLDKRIAEIAFKLPLKMKIRNFEGKWILKKILNNYLPNNLIKKRKKGFSVPISKWLRGPLNEWCNDLLSEELIKKQGFLDFKEIEKIRIKHMSGEKDLSSKLWAILMWQSWLLTNTKK